MSNKDIVVKNFILIVVILLVLLVKVLICFLIILEEVGIRLVNKKFFMVIKVFLNLGKVEKIVILIVINGMIDNKVI